MRDRHRALGCAAATVLLASCSFGPPLKSALPVVRDVPVLAGLPPSHALARARTYLAARQYGLAIELFKTAGRDPALELDSLNGLAIAYDGIGRGDLAERYFQKALALRTDDERTRRNLATFYAASGQQEKRRALLADRGAAAVAEDVLAPEINHAAIASSIAEGRDEAVAAKLATHSPLGDVFRPLLADATLFSPNETPDLEPAGETTVFCSAAFGTAAPQRPGASPQMVRISIGEVFIATQSDQMECAALPANPIADTPPPKMSNKAYLGLVAAYLEQLNHWHRFAGLALPARTGIS